MRQIFLIIALLLTISTLSRGQLNFDSSKIRRNILKSLDNFPNDSDTILQKKIFAFDRNTTKTISNEELIELTNFPKASVRMAALEILVDRRDINLPMLITKNSSDTTSYILVQFECSQGYMNFFDRLLFYMRPNFGLTKYFNLSKEQKDMIASIWEERKIRRAYYLASRQTEF